MNDLPATVDISPPMRTLPLWRFSVSELLLLTTMPAMICAGWKLHPALSLIFFTLMIPTVVRTWFSIRRSMRMKIVLSFSDQFETFCGSFLLSLVACFYFAVIVGAAFFMPFGLGFWRAAIVSGLIAAFFGAKVFCAIMRDTWPR